MDNRVIDTIGEPQFINIEPFNPMVSRCEIKVFYLGRNRNGSFIDKEVAEKIANSLPSCPIVGVFLEDKEDFGDHGDVITIEDGEVKFSCKTRPYGFVAPDAQVWFQKFAEKDAFGEEIEREYLMTTGYLWTGQYPEAQSILDGKGQSMELEEVKGSWANDDKTDMEFFIINDALFSKLCVLGDDVEPCFEGASVVSAKDGVSFANDQGFSAALFTMLHDMKETLCGEGGLDMPKEEKDKEEFVVAASGKDTAEEAQPLSEEEAKEEVTPADPEELVEEEVVEDDEPADAAADEAEPETLEEEEEEEEAEEADDSESDSDSTDGDFTAKYEDDDEDEEDEDEDEEDEPVDDSDDVEERKRKQQSALETELVELRAFKESAEAELSELRNFKHSCELAAKDKVIAKYHMLSDEDKKFVVDNRESLTIQQIDEKLALAYVKKFVDFSTVDGIPEPAEETTPEESLLFSLEQTIGVAATDDSEANSLFEALRSYKND